MKLSIILMCCTLLMGCYESNLPSSEVEFSHEDSLRSMVSHIDKSRLKLEKIKLTDGISFDEANTILDNFYLSGKADGCGAPGNIIDGGKHWKAVTFVGIAAKRSHPIFIDKTTGAIARNNEVLVTNPKTLTFEDPVYYINAKIEIKKLDENLKEHPNQKLKVDTDNAQSN